MSPVEKYNLCFAAMQGDKSALAQLGNPKDLGELDAISRDAFEQMTPAQKKADESAAMRELELVDPNIN